MYSSHYPNITLSFILMQIQRQLLGSDVIRLFISAEYQKHRENEEYIVF